MILTVLLFFAGRLSFPFLLLFLLCFKFAFIDKAGESRLQLEHTCHHRCTVIVVKCTYNVQRSHVPRSLYIVYKKLHIAHVPRSCPCYPSTHHSVHFLAPQLTFTFYLNWLIFFILLQFSSVYKFYQKITILRQKLLCFATTQPCINAYWLSASDTLVCSLKREIWMIGWVKYS